MPVQCRFILDSGAFSADKNKTPIDVYEYMDYLNETQAELYFNLDVIGDDDATWENQRVMENKGFSPLPVFHIEDKKIYLDKCISDYNYFALGGMAGGVHENARTAFLDTCFHEICKTPDYLPKCKVHGLGLASPLLLARYPFFSADTASGIHYGRYGIIILPQKTSSEMWNYLVPPHSLYITERSTAKQHEGHHFCNKSLDEKRAIKQYVRNQGFSWGEIQIFECSPDYELLDNEKFTSKEHTEVERVVKEGIVSNGVMRDYFNINFYMRMEEQIPEYPWSFKPEMRRMF